MPSSSHCCRTALVCLGALAMLVTACSSGATAADTAATDSGEDEVAWLFTQTADTGRLERTDDGVTRLVMNDVDLHTIMFAHRPDRSVEVVDTAALTDQWNEEFADSAPNAVLVEHEPDGATDSLVVVLDRPVLDTSARTLSYDVEVLADERHPDSLGGVVGKLHDEPPSEFGVVSLFIDLAPAIIIGLTAT